MTAARTATKEAPVKPAVAALAKAQKEMGAVLKNTANPHLKSKYADLGSVIDAALPALNDNGFALLQPIGRDEVGPFVETVLAHESGEEFRSRVYLIMGKNDMQAFGSATTYARRYGLLALAGLAPEDDDGHATRADAAPPKRPQDPRPLIEQAGPMPSAQEPVPPRDPAKVAASLMRLVGMATTKDELDHTLARPKFDEAWEWLALESPTHSALVGEAVDAARDRIEAATIPLPPQIEEAMNDDLRGVL